MQHVSTRDSVDMIRRARAKGIPVTGEATPHHLSLTDENVKKFDTNYKMNPPLRTEDDRQALIEGIVDGTITVIATDHAPHTETAKLVEFDHAPFGIIGLETALPVCFTQLVASGVITVDKLIPKLTTGPAEVLGIKNYSLAEGNAADITVFDPQAEYVIDKSKFRSKSRNTPFDGMTVRGKINLTVVDGKIVYREGC